MLIYNATRCSRDPSWSNQEVVRHEKFARSGVNSMNLLPFDRKKVVRKVQKEIQMSWSWRMFLPQPQMSCFRGAKVCTKWLREK